MRYGYSPDEIYDFFERYCNEIKYIEKKSIMKLIFGLILKQKIIIDGLNSGEKIKKFVNEICEKKYISNINQIKRKLIIPAVELNTGKIYLFSSIQNRSTYSNEIEYIYNFNIGKAVQASCSYPGIFSPCKYNEIKLIDGGIRENVPWKELKNNGADKVVSVVFEKEIDLNQKEKNIFQVVNNSIDILSYELSNYELIGADYLIKIKTKNIDLLDINKIEYLFELGYKIGKENIKNIKF